jgi:hypothetical protein
VEPPAEIKADAEAKLKAGLPALKPAALATN